MSTFFGFITVATFFGGRDFVGHYGQLISNLNLIYFGYLAYLLPIAAFWPIYRFYRSSEISLRRIETILSTLLLLFSLLILQALLFSGDFSGKIGLSIVAFLSPLIGTAGVWFVWLLLVALSLIILFDLDTDSIREHLTLRFPNRRSGENLAPIAPTPSPEAPRTVSNNHREPVGAFKEEYVEEIIHAHTTSEILDEEEIEIPEDGYDQKVRLVKQTPAATEPTPPTPVQTPAALAPKPEPTPATPPPPQPKTSPEIQVEEKEKNHRAAIVHELEENRELLAQVEQGKSEKPKNFKLPPLEFLQQPKSKGVEVNENEIDQKIEDLLDKLYRFKIEGDVVRTYSGPVVTTFEFRPAPHVKVSKILNLEDDLAMALKAKTIRIQAPVPGKDVVGIEIPNHSVDTIYLREVLEGEIFQNATSPLTIALGKDIVGKPFVTDLKKLPHLLIAGTTGSGKSVGINGMILSLLYKNSPDNLRLLMIDPKMLEFSIYNDIPHLLTPVITEPKKAVTALGNLVSEMERRNKMMSRSKAKNIENYNEKAKKEGFEPFPYIVVIIDELADLMMTSGKDVEYYIARLAQMARASGIHLIVATQRPSVDVVTGLIKANLPSRLSYKVGQKVDSKVILDQFGAETLLGRGDMLFTPPGITGLVRLHAPWSTEDEIDNIVEHLKAQREPDYDEDFLSNGSSEGGVGDDSGERDELYEDAKAIVLNDRKSSISYIQRKLQIGYNRAARIVEQLESAGVLSAADHKGNREIL